MPRKCKFKSEDILDAAFAVVREKGLPALSTRSVAKRLKCSTMPIYSFLKSKKNLEERIVKKAYELLREYQTTPRTGDTYMDMGAGFVIFAKDEKHLFRCIFNELHAKIHKRYSEENIDYLIEKMTDYPLIQGLSQTEIRKFFRQGWMYALGLALLVNSGYYPDMNDREICEELLYSGQRYLAGTNLLIKQSI